MRYSKIFQLAVVLVLILVVSIFVGTSVKEGILFKDLSTVKTILNGMDSDSHRLDLFKKMNISDPDFNSIINDNKLSDAEKVAKLKILVSVLLMDNVPAGKLNDVINTDISLKTVTNNAYDMRL
jgi:hypothetical protein